MAERSATQFSAPELTADDFRRVRRIAFQRAGLAIADGKEGLIRSRLAKRVRDRSCDSFAAYLDDIEGAACGDEIATLIDLLTTNKTDFFREPVHFEYLLDHVVPACLAAGEPLRLWSAGCSSGEEAYSLAMLLTEALPARHDFRILATDISTRMVHHAKRGVFTAAQLSRVDAERRERWFTPHADGGGVARAVIRAPISFAHLNLMSPWPMSGPFHAIFCRNVMLYFDRPTVTTLVERFRGLLSADGHLFIGLTESLTTIDHRYRYVQPSVYAR